MTVTYTLETFAALRTLPVRAALVTEEYCDSDARCKALPGVAVRVYGWNGCAASDFLPVFDFVTLDGAAHEVRSTVLEFGGAFVLGLVDGRSLRVTLC